MLSRAPFVHSTKLWEQSLAPAGPLLAFSELPRGRCPVDTETLSVNIVLEGEERYQVGDREYRVSAGEFLVLDPGTRAIATLAGAELVRGISVYLPQAAGRRSAGIDQSPTAGFRFRAPHHKLGRLLLALGRELAAGVTPSVEAAATLIQAAEQGVDHLVAQTSAEMLRLSSRRPATRRHILQQIHIARDYLLAHRTRSVSLAELSVASGMSPFHLTRSFAAVFGMPPLRYHATARLNAANEALRTGRISSIDAFAHFGFSDRSSFARAFHNRFGIYPAVAARDAAAVS